jgi:PAS domain S-box-containing protein
MNLVDSSREFAWIRERLAEIAPLRAAIIATNLQGQVAYWNSGAERLYGWPEEEALGRDILELTPAKYTLQQSAEIMRSLQTGDGWQGDILLRRRDGTPMMAFVLNVPVGDFTRGQGAIVGISEAAENRAAIEGLAAHLGNAVRRCFQVA